MAVFSLFLIICLPPNSAHQEIFPLDREPRSLLDSFVSFLSLLRLHRSNGSRSVICPNVRLNLSHTLACPLCLLPFLLLELRFYTSACER